MVIAVLDLVPHCHSWAEGEVLGHLLRQKLADGKVTLSFAGVDDIPSSFANAAFVRLLDHFSLDTIQDRLSVVNSTRQINDMIKRRLTNQAGLVAA